MTFRRISFLSCHIYQFKKLLFPWELTWTSLRFGGGDSIAQRLVIGWIIVLEASKLICCHTQGFASQVENRLVLLGVLIIHHHLIVEVMLQVALPLLVEGILLDLVVFCDNFARSDMLVRWYLVISIIQKVNSVITPTQCRSYIICATCSRILNWLDRPFFIFVHQKVVQVRKSSFVVISSKLDCIIL